MDSVVALMVGQCGHEALWQGMPMASEVVLTNDMKVHSTVVLL